MSEWNIMYDRQCDNPSGKNWHVYVRDLKDLRKRRQDTSQFSFTSINPEEAGWTVEKRRLANSDRCLLDADRVADSLQVACSLTRFQLAGYIEYYSWSVFSCANGISGAKVALETSNCIQAFICCQKRGMIIQRLMTLYICLLSQQGVLTGQFKVMFVILKAVSPQCLLSYSTYIDLTVGISFSLSVLTP